MVSARLCAVLAAALSLGASFGAHAVGTAAGTTIQNAAQVTYTVAGVSATTSSNTVAVGVAEILDVVVTIAQRDGHGRRLAPLSRNWSSPLTNTGNGPSRSLLLR